MSQKAKYTENNHLSGFIDNNKNIDSINYHDGRLYHCGVIRALYDFFGDDYELHNESVIWSKIKQE